MTLAAATSTATVMASSTSAPKPSPPFDQDDQVWYGNIQYLLNISAVGAASCVLLFLLVKVRSDHRRFPGPSALLAKLLAVFHATASQIALHCGADASQFLHIERSSFRLLLSISALAVLFALPLNLYSGPSSPTVDDLFARTTVNHIPTSSPILWLHFLLMLLVIALTHRSISAIEESLRITRFRDGNGSPSDPNANSIAVFTLIVHGIPKPLAADKAPLEAYLHYRYPGKVSRVVVPFDLCTLDELVRKWDNLHKEISRLESRTSATAAALLLDEENESGGLLRNAWKNLVGVRLGPTDHDRLVKLRSLRSELAVELSSYREGRAQGAGIAFVVFKDVFTANKAARDLRHEGRYRPTGEFFPLMELQLERNRWSVEHAPPAADIYWNHVGSSKLSLRLRRIAVNTCLVLMLLFFSSPLAIITALKRAARIINAEAVDHAQLWFAWLESSSWFAAVILQFLPNVIIFVSMYVVVPSVLSYLSKFERHLTMSGEQRAALLKMVCFFLVNLIILKVMVETSLENALLKMGRCYLDGEDCKKIEQYMSGSFLTKSCLSALAFLITCTFLGISFDLLAPVPWIKRTMKKFQKNDMLQLVPEQSEDHPLDDTTNNVEANFLRMPLISENDTRAALNGGDLLGQDLSAYPVNRSFHVPKQTFDFAQYYAFNLTVFALTLIYSLFAPLVVPVGAAYFGYRYLVDKYNFLFVYRPHGFPAGNDGKLMDRVLYVMHFCVILFLLAMMLFFSAQGDSLKLQAILTFVLLVFYALYPSKNEGFQPSLLEGLQTVDSFIDGPTDYESFSKPMFDWNRYRT